MPLIDKFGVGDPVGAKAAKILPQFAPADQHPHRVQISFVIGQMSRRLSMPFSSR